MSQVRPQLNSKAAETPSLPNLPREILPHITSLLDTHSAIQLAQTCSALVKPSEARIWRRLRITDKDILDDCYSSPRSDSDSKEGDKDQHDENAVLRRSPSGAWALGSERLIKRFIDLLTTSPWRRGYVKILDLEMHHRVPVILADLIGMVADTLEEVRLVFPASLDSKLSNHPTPRFAHIIDILSKLSEQPLIGLARVHIDIKSHFDETIATLLSAAPNLTSLSIEAQHFFNAHEEHQEIAVQPHYRQISEIVLHKLDRLIISECYPPFTPTLTTLIESAPNLSHVEIGHWARMWTPDSKEPMLIALSRLKNLRVLRLNSTVFDALCNVKGFEAVEELSMVWDFDILLSSQREHGSVVPPLPNLRKYQIELSLDSWRMSAQMETAPPPPEAISLTLIAQGALQVLQTPQLTTIHLPSYDYLRYDPRINTDMDADHRDQDGLGIPTYDDPAFQGVVAYSWSNEHGDILVHLRSRTVSRTHDRRLIDSGVKYVGEWEEYAWFNGRALPIGVLASVYGATGMSPPPHCGEPKRGMELASRGWAVLRIWEKDNPDSNAS
ncbi:hypothetical protein CI109_103698 [Kwoniella shandongensis]|uniref:Uncharacterized protein n=1 Tax=Kwoniella shandongensis TaxID=1734106 RepID=A0A5M6C7S7_9TREE|nr:uncharacterized protein CI109_000605 [Kwoniella shandongensis]KAA5531033.1 hypothetical protein CI109_000605 [Kwoniella shandongensis]